MLYCRKLHLQIVHVAPRSIFLTLPMYTALFILHKSWIRVSGAIPREYVPSLSSAEGSIEMGRYC